MKKNLNILITGTSSGFGKLTAKTLAKEGHQVFATMRDIQGHNQQASNDLKKWANSEGVSIEVYEIDVTDQKSIDRAVKKIIDEYQKIDVLINNAGIGGSFGLTEAFEEKEYRKIFDVNVFGSVRMINSILPYMRKQKEGLIIQISSIVGRSVMPFSGFYSASKWAVDSLSESYYYDLAQIGIESVMVEPGAFPTQFAEKTEMKEGDLLNEYGPVKEYFQKYKKKFEEFIKGDNAQDPQKVADTIREIINTKPGERPLRTVVDQNSKSYEKLNDKLLTYRDSFLQQFNIEHLKKVNRKAS